MVTPIDNSEILDLFGKVNRANVTPAYRHRLPQYSSGDSCVGTVGSDSTYSSTSTASCVGFDGTRVSRLCCCRDRSPTPLVQSVNQVRILSVRDLLVHIRSFSSFQR